MATDHELKLLASQLKHPSGEKGIEIANMMNETNIGMTKHAIGCLNIKEGDIVLELGHGNGGHIAYLLQQAEKLTYYGLEMSALMNAEAHRINETFVERDQALFYLYDCITIPFADNFFDKIFTVNTIYFWSNPVKLLEELHRVIKPGGILCITFALKSFMEQLPFTKVEFELYDEAKIKSLIAASDFELVDILSQIEKVKTKTGEMVEREFVSVLVKK